VLRSFAQTYGAKVLQPIRIVSGDERLGFIPVLILGGGLGLVVATAVRASRRKSHRRVPPRRR